MKTNSKIIKIASFIIGAVFVALAFIEPIPFILRIVFSVSVYLFFGLDVIREMIEGIKEKEFFSEYSMMVIATVGAFAIGEFADAAAVMLFYSLGEYLTDLACDRSKDSIEELMDRNPEYANLLSDGGKTERVAPAEVKIGDRIVVLAGEKIPLDGKVIEGNASADVSAITGEALPMSLSVGTHCISGSVCLDGRIVVEVETLAESSVASKISSAAKEALESKSDGEKFVNRFSKVYTPCAFAFALLVFAVGAIVTKDVRAPLRLSIVILAISCPCALVLSVPLTFISGLGSASSRGIMFRGANALERTAKLKAVVFDKTGTITSGKLNVTGIIPSDGVLEEEMDEILPSVASVLSASNHPLAKTFSEYWRGKTVNSPDLAAEKAGMGIVGETDGRKIICGNTKLLSEYGISAPHAEETAIHFAVNGRYYGHIGFADSIKDGAKEQISYLRKLGITRLAMISGDTKNAAEKVSESVGIDECYAELLPNEKAEKFAEIKKSEDGLSAFCGDGLNDAATIAGADVGIAMGGSGAALSIEAADLVLMNDELSTLCDGIVIAKKTERIAKQNVAISLIAKVAILAFSIAVSPSMELAVIADVGVTLLCVLNAVRRKIR